MASAKKCDRCGKYYDNNEAIRQGITNIGDSTIIAIKYVYHNNISVERFDLCDDCVQKLKDFMMMREG